MNGVLYIARGEAARREAVMSIRALREHNQLSVTVIADVPMAGVNCIRFEDRSPGARWSKVNADRLTPYAHTLYLDADTRPRGDLSAGFAALADGWDVAMTASAQQGSDWCWHCAEAEREATRAELGASLPQLQCGVLWFAQNARTAALFAAWREEWARWKGPDQAAFLRALKRAPVRLWLMARDFNGGNVIEHRFGVLRRNN